MKKDVEYFYMYIDIDLHGFMLCSDAPGVDLHACIHRSSYYLVNIRGASFIQES